MTLLVIYTYIFVNLNLYLHDWIIGSPRLDARDRRPPAPPSARHCMSGISFNTAACTNIYNKLLEKLGTVKWRLPHLL